MSEATFHPSYTGDRDDIEGLLCGNPKAVLDVGCSTGVLGASIKARFGSRVVGIELSQEMADVAAKVIDQVLVGDALAVLLRGSLDGNAFDTIIFADSLEHMSDPWGVLRASVKYLSPNGVVIASIPNVGHFDTVFNLVFRRFWPYRERGIHDRTHVRFFTRKNIVELFEGAGLSIEAIEANYRLLERVHDINRFAKYFAFPGIRSFLAFQYLVRGRLNSAAT